MGCKRVLDNNSDRACFLEECCSGKTGISDNGYGIPPKYIERIFDRFFQVEAKDEGFYSGNNKGLGLTFCKLVVDLHKGTITVDSEEDKGSRFEVYFP